MNQEQAQEMLDALRAAYPSYEWSTRLERGEWRVYGLAMIPYRSLEVRAGYIARYYACATLQSVEHDSWSGSADDPLDALREAIAGFNGRWEDQALHIKHMISVLQERRAELLRDVEQCEDSIATLEADLREVAK